MKLTSQIYKNLCTKPHVFYKTIHCSSVSKFSPKIPPLLHQQPVQFVAHLFGEGADGDKLFLQILQIMEFGGFADLDEAGGYSGAPAGRQVNQNIQ